MRATAANRSGSGEVRAALCDSAPCRYTNRRSMANQPWWALELGRLRAPLSAFVRRRLPIDPEFGNEVVEQAAVELSARLPAEQEQYPASWFTSEGPQAEQDITSYHGLVWTIVRRRLQDRLRSDYLQRLPSNESVSPSPNLENVIDARRLLAALAARINRLPVEDRELIAKATDSDDVLTGSERIRLHRLRRKLIRWLGASRLTR